LEVIAQGYRHVFRNKGSHWRGRRDRRFRRLILGRRAEKPPQDSGRAQKFKPDEDQETGSCALFRQVILLAAKEANLARSAL
jgi:hypothetical protein